MGSFLGKLCPSPPPPAWGREKLLGAPGCLQQAHRSLRIPSAGRGHPAAAGSTGRPSYQCPVSPFRQFVTAAPRHSFMILRTLYFFLGVFTAICWRHIQRKRVLSACNSKINLANVVDKLTLCLANTMWFLTSRCAQDSRSEKTVLKVMEESRNEMAKQEEDPAVGERQDGQRRGPDGTGRPRSAFRPLRVNGGLSSFVPRPGPLKRSPHSKSSEDNSIKTSQTSFLSSRIKQNAITSSYSSTRGFPPRQRRSRPATSQSCLPRSSTEKVSPESHQSSSTEKVNMEGHQSSPTEKVNMEGHRSSSTEKVNVDSHQSSSTKKENLEGHWSSSSASVSSQRKIQCEKAPDVTSRQKQISRTGSPTSESSRPRKRKIPLLRWRRGDPLVLPPAPQPGYRVTTEDVDREKRAVLQRINIALGGKTQTISDYSITRPSRTSPRRAAETAPPSAAPADPSIKSKKKKGKKKQDSPGPDGIWDWPSCNLLEWLPL